jgi:hypothetical protein
VAAGKTDGVQRMIVAFGANAALLARRRIGRSRRSGINRAQHQCDSAKHIPDDGRVN